MDGYAEDYCIDSEGEACFKIIEKIRHIDDICPVLVVVAEVILPIVKHNNDDNSATQEGEKAADVRDKIHYISTENAKFCLVRVESEVESRNNLLWRYEKREILSHTNRLKTEIRKLHTRAIGSFDKGDSHAECFDISFGVGGGCHELCGAWISTRYYKEVMIQHIVSLLRGTNTIKARKIQSLPEELQALQPKLQEVANGENADKVHRIIGQEQEQNRIEHIEDTGLSPSRRPLLDPSKYYLPPFHTDLVNGQHSVICDNGEACTRNVNITGDLDETRQVLIGIIEISVPFYIRFRGSSTHKIASAGDRIHYIYSETGRKIWFKVKPTLAVQDNILWCCSKEKVLNHGTLIETTVHNLQTHKTGTFRSKGCDFECFLVSFRIGEEEREYSDVWICSDYYIKVMMPQVISMRHRNPHKKLPFQPKTPELPCIKEHNQQDQHLQSPQLSLPPSSPHPSHKTSNSPKIRLRSRNKGYKREHTMNDNGEAKLNDITDVESIDLTCPILLCVLEVVSTFHRSINTKERIADVGDKIHYIYSEISKKLLFRVESKIRCRNNIFFRRSREEVLGHCNSSSALIYRPQSQEKGVFYSDGIQSECFSIPFGTLHKVQKPVRVWISTKYYMETIVPFMNQLGHEVNLGEILSQLERSRSPLPPQQIVPIDRFKPPQQPILLPQLTQTQKSSQLHKTEQEFQSSKLHKQMQLQSQILQLQLQLYALQHSQIEEEDQSDLDKQDLDLTWVFQGIK